MEAHIKYLEKAMDEFKEQNQKEHNAIVAQNSDEHKEIKQMVGSTNAIIANLDQTVRQAMDKKADKEDLNQLDNRFWQIVVAIIVAFIGLIVTAIKTFIK